MSMNRRRGGAEEADADAKADVDILERSEATCALDDATRRKHGAATRGRTEPAATTLTRARRAIAVRTNAARISKCGGAAERST